jgi:hypothetical protein
MQQTLQQAVQHDVALHKCDITLHAALRAFLSTQVKKQLVKRKRHQERMQRCMQQGMQPGVQRDVVFLRKEVSFAAYKKRMSLQQPVRCTSKLHIQNASVINP